jgi:hypothetical protein
MIAFILIAMAIIGVVLLVIYWYKSHSDVCPNPKCSEKVWLKLKDATPGGPNPLGIHITHVTLHCLKCGTYKQWNR